MEGEGRKIVEVEAARAIIREYLGENPDSPNIQNVIDAKLVNNMDLLERVLKSPDRDGVVETVAEIWEAIYTLGLREKPGSSDTSLI
jgi:hypothetical protein